MASACASPRINSTVPGGTESVCDPDPGLLSLVTFSSHGRAGTKTIAIGSLERTRIVFCSIADGANPERDGLKVAQDEITGYLAPTGKEPRRGRLKIVVVLLGLFLLLGTITRAQENAGGRSASDVTTGGIPPVPPVSPILAPPIPKGAVVLDHVVAVINGSVILQSDVMEEMSYAFLQPFSAGARNTPQRALQRLIDRDLILQQMETAQTVTPPTPEEIQQRVAELRAVIPECLPDHCQTDADWRAFLHSKGLTEKEVDAHWAQRISILSFIQSRFGAGVRITPAEIADYYNKTLVPLLRAKQVNPPALQAVSGRIEEILLQQRVSSLLLEWLQSLKSEGSVSILDPAYGKVGTTGLGDEAESGGQP
jgi:peptidyl-prolyl cis-trans isomerase SurA